MVTNSKEGIPPHPLLWWCSLFILCSCLNGVTAAPLDKHCKNLIEVNRKTGMDCSTITAHSLVNKTCNDLQDALMRVSDQTFLSFGECIEVVVHSGTYRITEFITIHQNVVLHGTQNVTVTFSLNDTLYPTNTPHPYYMLTFADSDNSGISGIDFHTSPGIITFQNMTHVTVENCSFRYFTQGALDIYNCQTALITNCTFEHNGPASVNKSERYRGHAGGLSVGYHQEGMVSSRPQLRVERCTFRNNTNDPLASIQQSTTQLLQQGVYTGRGGGCAIIITSFSPLNGTLEDCVFEENFARSYGGGLYITFDGQLNHSLVLNRARFVRNSSPTGGGLVVGYASFKLDLVSSLFVYNSEFVENGAEFGAGMYLVTAGPLNSDGKLSHFAHFENCTFTGNRAKEFGAAMGFTFSSLKFQSMENIEPFEIESCTFNSNDGRGGTVNSAYIPLSFRGNTTFNANKGRSFVAQATMIEVHGSIHFIGNIGSGIGSGALYITSMAQLRLFKGANLIFRGNTGVRGAAIVVDTFYVPDVYSQLLFNPLCFLLYNESQSPEHWENVSFTFSANKALIASAVLMTDLELCSWTQFENPHFDPARVFRWGFVHFNNDNRNTAHEPDAFNPEWYIQTPAKRIHVTTDIISAYPGEQFQLGVKAFDELGRPTTTIFRLEEEDARAHYIISPSVSMHHQIKNFSLNASFYKLGGSSEAEKIFVESLLVEESTRDSFYVVSTSCPPGYVLSAAPLQGNMSTTCACDNNDSSILGCNGRSIILKDGLWGTQDMSQQLVTYPCPPQYCQCALGVQGRTATCRFTFDSLDSDSQCNCDREGVLCGNCRNGYGVSVLLNKCVTCHDASGILIVVLILIDVLVLTGLMLLVKVFPVWLYPCLFYLQALPYLTEHFPPTFEKVHPYAYYMSSGLSFYFIYDFCLYHGMSAPVSYLLRYLPLSLALVICFTILVMRQNQKKLLNLAAIRYIYKKPCDPWYGLWWIVMLMYTHVVHTSMSILNCPALPGRSGDYVPRWYINGNISCFTGGHAPLGLLAIIVLTFCLSIIPITLVYSMGWLQHPGWLRHTAVVMRKGFKKRYKWWATVELGRRTLLLLSVVLFPGKNYPVIVILLVITTVFGFLQPYENLYCNVLECLLSLDVLLLLMRNTAQISEKLQVLPQQTSNRTTVGTCRREVEGITRFSWLLFLFYYFPLIVFLVAGTIWMAFNVKHYVLKKHQSRTVTIPQQDDVGRIQRAVTTTHLDLEALEEIDYSGLDNSVTVTSDSF